MQVNISRLSSGTRIDAGWCFMKTDYAFVFYVTGFGVGRRNLKALVHTVADVADYVIL